MANPSVSVIVDKVHDAARQEMVREIIAECLRRAELQSEAYWREHPKARWLSGNVEGAIWAFNSLGRDLCKRHIGHVFADTEKEGRRQCSVCGALEAVDGYEAENSDAQPCKG